MNTKEKPKKNNKVNDLKKKAPKFNIMWVYLITCAALLIFWQVGSTSSGAEEIYEVKFHELISNQDIESATYVRKDSRVNITLKEQSIKKKKDFEAFRKDNLKGPHYFMMVANDQVFNENLNRFMDRLVAEKLMVDTTLTDTEVRKQYQITIKQNTSRSWGSDFFMFLPFIIIMLIFFFTFRSMRGGGGAGGGGLFSIGKSKAQLFDGKNQQKVSFKDVAGLEGAKYEVEEIVDFLKNPKKYTQLGGKIPKGALLVGPPGTGKTLLAKAVAGEANVPFFSLSGSDFVEMFVGVGASRVRDLFKSAKEKAPCIIFIDEIDAVGRSRGKSNFSGANDERENTLNQLLTEMDGFSTNAGIIMLAATNRADVLDKALLRAGRFDRQIHVDLPNLPERKGIFEVHVKNLKLDDTVDLSFFAKQTPGFSGADIANVCNEAALIAARNNKKKIDKEDFLSAVDRIVGGLEKRGSLITPEEKKVIAYHEAGHASVSWLLKYAHPLVKVTIVPRGKSLGAAWYLPEERHITNTEQLFDEMCATLGGRAAEEVMFGKISTGALNDLERVTKQAYAMVVYYGLNKKVGNISYYDSSGQSEYAFQKPYSEATAQKIDQEISALVEEGYKRAKGILEENKDKLTLLAEQLLDKEVIFADDLEKIFGKREGEEIKDVETEEIKETENKA